MKKRTYPYSKIGRLATRCQGEGINQDLFKFSPLELQKFCQTALKTPIARASAYKLHRLLHIEKAQTIGASLRASEASRGQPRELTI